MTDFDNFSLKEVLGPILSLLLASPVALYL